MPHQCLNAVPLNHISNALMWFRVQVRSLCRAFFGNFLSSQPLLHISMRESTFVNTKWSSYISEKISFCIQTKCVHSVGHKSRSSATRAYGLFLDDVSVPGTHLCFICVYRSACMCAHLFHSENHLHPVLESSPFCPSHRQTN